MSFLCAMMQFSPNPNQHLTLHCLICTKTHISSVYYDVQEKKNPHIREAGTIKRVSK